MQVFTSTLGRFMGRFEHLGCPKLSKFRPFIVSTIVSLSDVDLIEFLYILNN